MQRLTPSSLANELICKPPALHFNPENQAAPIRRCPCAVSLNAALSERSCVSLDHGDQPDSSVLWFKSFKGKINCNLISEYN